MPTTNTFGVGVRHAVTRALATHNLAPADATFRVESSRATVDARGRVVRAEATVRMNRSHTLAAESPDRWTAWVNPDGEHPLMVRIPGPTPFWMDVVPVTWDRWARRRDITIPPGIDFMSPRVGIRFDDAQAFAAELGKRLPTAQEVKQAWGATRFPWGDSPAPELGRDRPHRWGELPEVGLHPPNTLGIWDLGAWVWQWTAEGLLFGGAPGGEVVEPHDDRHPVALRMVRDA